MGSPRLSHSPIPPFLGVRFKGVSIFFGHEEWGIIMEADIEQYTTERAKKEGIYFKPFALFKHIKRLTGSEYKVYGALCTCMIIETFLSEITIGQLERWTGYCWYPTIRNALQSLEKKGFIRVVSLRLSEERAYRKDALSIRMRKLR